MRTDKAWKPPHTCQCLACSMVRAPAPLPTVESLLRCAVPLTYVILLRLCGYRCPANLCEWWESPDFLQLETFLRQTKRMEAAKKFVAGPQDRRFQSENGAPFSGPKTCPRC